MMAILSSGDHIDVFCFSHESGFIPVFVFSVISHCLSSFRSRVSIFLSESGTHWSHERAAISRETSTHAATGLFVSDMTGDLYVCRSHFTPSVDISRR